MYSVIKWGHTALIVTRYRDKHGMYLVSKPMLGSSIRPLYRVMTHGIIVDLLKQGKITVIFTLSCNGVIYRAIGYGIIKIHLY